MQDGETVAIVRQWGQAANRMNLRPRRALQSKFILQGSDDVFSRDPAGVSRPRSNIGIEPGWKPPVEVGEFSTVADPLQNAAGRGNPQERTAAVDMRGVQVVYMAKPVCVRRLRLERTLNEGIGMDSPDYFASAPLGGIDRQSE